MSSFVTFKNKRICGYPGLLEKQIDSVRIERSTPWGDGLKSGENAAQAFQMAGYGVGE